MCCLQMTAHCINALLAPVVAIMCMTAMDARPVSVEVKVSSYFSFRVFLVVI